MTEFGGILKEHQRRITNIESACGIIDKRIPFAKQRLDHAAMVQTEAQIDLDVHALMQDLLTRVEEIQIDNEQEVFNNWFSTHFSNEEAVVATSDDECENVV